jgi:hypothetical protein
MDLLPVGSVADFHLLPDSLDVPSKLVDLRVLLVLSRAFREPLSENSQSCLDASERQNSCSVRWGRCLCFA